MHCAINITYRPNMRIEHTIMLIKKYISIYLYKYRKTIKHNTINCFKKCITLK